MNADELFAGTTGGHIAEADLKTVAARAEYPGQAQGAPGTHTARAQTRQNDTGRGGRS